MRRDTLRLFFRRAVKAALPLALAACGNHDCPQVVQLPGGVPHDSYGVVDCRQVCPATCSACVAHEDGGTPEVMCTHPLATGRRPPSLRAGRGSRARDPLGRLAAEMAHLEAASVIAFRSLAGELRDHGAPDALVARALAAAVDEVAHARVTAAIARARGAAVAEAAADPAPARDLAEIAVDNAAEGCVREGFGALVATWQAAAAGDPRFRRAMARIAVDETRHAELAWAIARFAEPRLPRAARRRVDESRRAALADLRREAARAPHPILVARAGLPPAAAALALVDRFAEEVARRGLAG